jgi:hypothetical protein
MALRWASVGACENAGVATAKSAVRMNAACAVAGINVLTILKTLIVVVGADASTKMKFLKSRSKNSDSIIFFFEFYCK